MHIQQGVFGCFKPGLIKIHCKPHMRATYGISNFLTATFQKVKIKNKINSNNSIYLTSIPQISLQHRVNVLKLLMRYFTGFYPKHLKPDVDFTLTAHLSVDPAHVKSQQP